MSSGDLRAVLRIKHMAEAAAEGRDPPGPAEAEETVKAYVRLREETRKLNERAGWSPEDFDEEVPKGDFTGAPVVARLQGGYTGDESHWLVSIAGPRARFLLRQLAAWAAGHAEAFEIEARLKADAEAKRSGGRQTGFR